MPRLVQLLIFIGLVTLVTGSMHYYAWARLLRDTSLSAAARTAGAAAIAGLFVFMIAAIPLSRSLPRSVATPIMWVAYCWMGTILLLNMVLFAVDALRLLGSLIASGGGADNAQRSGSLFIDPQRRLWLKRALAVGSLGATAALVGTSMWGALRRVGIRKIAVTLQRLPQELDGLRIVQLTDLHVGPTIDGRWLRQIVEQVNQLDADVIAITGDLVDGPVERLREHVAPLRDLRARHGVYFVTGNHEYYAGVDAWLVELERLGVKVLRNQRVTIHPRGAAGPALDLAGVDDFHSHSFPGHGPDLPRALLGRPAGRPLVLLAHQPAAIEEAAAHGVDLQLSGHTHGGQIWPWRYFVRLQQPYVAGLHRHPGTDTQIYISCGTGYWGPPMRLGAPAEISHVTLRAAQQA